eukprot:9733_1
MANRSFSQQLNPQIQQLLDKVKEVVYDKPFTYISDKTSNQWSIFKRYVEHNRKWMRFCEDALTKISFFLPGRWGDSGEIGEFVYGLGLVLQTLNDRALNEESTPSICCGTENLSTKNVKSFVQLLQHMQLFVELLAIKKLSNQNRWKLVLLIEFIKMLCRLYLLFYFNGHMLIMQNEDEMKYNERIQQTESNENKYANLQKMYVEHGRGKDPNGYWSPLSKQQQQLVDNSQLMAHVTLHRVKYPQRNGLALKRSVCAEILYIIRPVIYVASFLRFGDTSWIPFFISLIMDIYTQMMHFASPIVTSRQRTELSRRRKYWLLYLLRPPFFNTYIKNYLNKKTESFKDRSATFRYWILMMFTNLLCQFQSNHFNISASTY